jgi:hypothetical protein
MAAPYPRDLIGYGAHPPDPKWPNGARLALNLVLNYEEGSEYSVPDGDGFSEVTLTELGSFPANLKAAGYDICCHGWRWINHFELDEATEREHTRKAIASLQASVGTGGQFFEMPKDAFAEADR